MKKITIIFISLILSILVLNYFYIKMFSVEEAETKQSENVDTVSKTVNDYHVFKLEEDLEIVTKDSEFNPEVGSSTFLPEELVKHMPKRVRKMDKFQRLMHKEIDFYGQIKDQFDYPVADVQLVIYVKQVDISSTTINLPVYTKTDSQGKFHLTGVLGNSFSIKGADKEGFLFSEMNENFGAQFKRVNTTKESPYTFNAWRIMEKPTKLRKWKGTITDDPAKTYTIDMKIDPTKSDYENKYKFRAGSNGDFVIDIEREFRLDQQVGNSYTIQIKLNNGLGIRKQINQYEYIAPLNGYQTSVTENWDFETGGGEIKNYSQKFYVKGIDGSNYGLLYVNINPFWRKNLASVLFTAKINTTGSRNLLTKEVYAKTLDANKLAYPQTSKSKFYREDKLVNKLKRVE